MDSLVEVFSWPCTGDLLIAVCLHTVKDPDRWSLGFRALEQHVLLLHALWHSKCEDLLRTEQVSQALTTPEFLSHLRD